MGGHKLRQEAANQTVREMMGEKTYMKKERERDLLMFTLSNQYLSPPPLLLRWAFVSML